MVSALLLKNFILSSLFMSHVSGISDHFMENVHFTRSYFTLLGIRIMSCMV